MNVCFQNREIPTSRKRFQAIASPLASSSWPRSPLAPDPRPVRNPRLRVHASANAGRHRHPLLPQMVAQVSRFRLTSARFGRCCASCVARARLLRSRAKSPRHSQNRYGSPSWKLPTGHRANATTPRNREIHCACSGQLCFPSICPNRRSEHSSCVRAVFQFSRIDRFRRGPEDALATCRESSPKIRCRDFQLRSSRSRRAYLRSPEAEMRCVPRRKPVPRKESGCTPVKEFETRNETTLRNACINR